MHILSVPNASKEEIQTLQIKLGNDILVIPYQCELIEIPSSLSPISVSGNFPRSSM